MLSRLGAAVLTPAVEIYIRHQRDRLDRSAYPLAKIAKTSMQAYFPVEVLESVRVIIADPLPIADPPFSNVVNRLGFDFPSPSLTDAITFDYIIAAKERMDESVLLHELVHVVQFQLMGVRAFAHEYIRGFLDTRDYFSIPLERCAFDLQFRFEKAAGAIDAEAEIRRYLQGS
jgi:hypothetical protein